MSRFSNSPKARSSNAPGRLSGDREKFLKDERSAKAGESGLGNTDFVRWLEKQPWFFDSTGCLTRAGYMAAARDWNCLPVNPLDPSRAKPNLNESADGYQKHMLPEWLAAACGARTSPSSLRHPFRSALRRVLNAEGGYKKFSQGEGGATMRGVTQDAYDRFRRNKHLTCRGVQSITMSETEQLYYRDYWLKGGCEKLPRKVAYCHFDSCILMGPDRANAFLARVLKRKGVSEEDVQKLNAGGERKLLLAYIKA